VNETRPVKLGCVLGAKNCLLQLSNEYSWLVVEKAHLEFGFIPQAVGYQYRYQNLEELMRYQWRYLQLWQARAAAFLKTFWKSVI